MRTLQALYAELTLRNARVRRHVLFLLLDTACPGPCLSRARQVFRLLLAGREALNRAARRLLVETILA